MASDEVEHRARLAIEVVVRWRGDVLSVSHLSSPGAFFVTGSSSSADVALPPEWLGSERLCVAVGSRTEVSAVLPAHVRCWCTLPDGSTRSVQPGGPELTSPSPERLLPLALGHRAHLCFGEIQVEVAAVPAGRAPARRRWIGFDPATLAYFGLSSISMAGVLALLSLMAPPTGLTRDEQTEHERLYLLQTYLQASTERAENLEREKAAPAVSARVATTTRPPSPRPRTEAAPIGAEEEEAPPPPAVDPVLGIDDAAPVAPDARERRAQIEEARGAGIIGLLRENLEALRDPRLPFRRELSSAELGNLQRLFNPDWDPLLGDDGPGGLALSGTGIRGGGNANVIALGAVGTIGGGEGKGLDRAEHFGNPSGSHRPEAPELRASTAAASHALAPALVRRTVNAQFSSIRGCYEQQLASNPTLAGSVVVRFVVQADGHVDHVSTEGVDLPADMRSCIAGIFQGLSFPSPGSAVNAIYPLRLAP